MAKGFSCTQTKIIQKRLYCSSISGVLKAIKPIYKDLSKDALLERYDGGFIQNNNKMLMLFVELLQKKLSSTSNIVKITAYVAVCNFDDGSFGLLIFLEKIDIGTCSTKFL